MSTTTIRIEDDLKERVAAAADRAGKTAHAFIVDAIAQTVAQAEMEEELHRIADERWAKVLATGKTVPWSDAKKYLVARVQGVSVRKPVARKLGH
ncbi:CopG family transcriptional regulator [Variovorax paradoxus]|nr:CopG family transcriptional regulator [Variovorax paradoxus]